MDKKIKISKGLFDELLTEYKKRLDSGDLHRLDEISVDAFTLIMDIDYPFLPPVTFRVVSDDGKR